MSTIYNPSLNGPVKQPLAVRRPRVDKPRPEGPPEVSLTSYDMASEAVPDEFKAVGLRLKPDTTGSAKMYLCYARSLASQLHDVNVRAQPNCPPPMTVVKVGTSTTLPVLYLSPPTVSATTTSTAVVE